MDDQLSIEVEEVEGVRKVTITFTPIFVAELDED